MTPQTCVPTVIGTVMLTLFAINSAHAQYPYPLEPLFGVGSALRVDVTPNDAEVFLDGYLVGTVDVFDGFFQRLRARPGEHEIEIYKDGYHSVLQKIYLSPASTFRVKYDMQPLRTGETPDPRPVPRNPSQTPRGPRDRDREGGGPRNATGVGSISIQVQPDDAEVLIDGEEWEHGGAGERLVLQIPQGRRHVEVRKPGLRTFSQDVDIRSGETVTLNVSLL